MNERLRAAMIRAGVDAGALADGLGVGNKTVRRWLAGQRPYERHRWAIGRLLGVDERELWPERAAPRAENWQSAELVDVYAYRADLPAERWWALLQAARVEVALLDYTLSFLFEAHPRLSGLLVEKAGDGCSVRLAVADPDCEHVLTRDREEGVGGGLVAQVRMARAHLRPLLDRPGVEIRQYATFPYSSVFRFDDELLVTAHLHQAPDYAAPLLHLRRVYGEGPFDRFAAHLDAVWEAARPIHSCG